MIDFWKKVVGHVPLYWSKLAFKFVQFQNLDIRVAVTGKRVNRETGLSLQLPVDYFFLWRQQYHSMAQKTPSKRLTDASMKK